MREVVIDVNVFITAITPNDAEQRECVEFLNLAHDEQDGVGLVVREPPLFVLEMFAVWNRVIEQKKLDVSLYPRFLIIPGAREPLRTTVEPFTEEDAHSLMEAHSLAFPVQSPKGAKRFPLVKGGDLSYLAVARNFKCPLITTDPGLLEYGRLNFARALRPSAWPPP